ncbi:MULTISPECIES: hypothetical protein [Sulfurimonas]|uniref:hypothetical protein n=1 Tax=Sulfurimonas TaxID=202746 RepID=UPI00165F5742|nr:hypothetical protein [Sulfurimonas indica]
MTKSLSITRGLFSAFAGLILGLLIAISYELYNGGIMIAGEYKVYYWADVFAYIKNLF